MKKTIAIICIALLSLSLMLASCGGEEKTICGTWIQLGENNMYIFNEDGSGRHETLLQKVDITYEINDEYITIHDKTLWVIESTEVYNYELDGDTLRLTDGEKTLTFARQAEVTE